ncbi:hypothetical protein GJ496_009115 [Pomphorhynchus laevis]|nr:hypothetical protein GJ496_009115 [Pomphorhynchus laevis]
MLPLLLCAIYLPNSSSYASDICPHNVSLVTSIRIDIVVGLRSMVQVESALPDSCTGVGYTRKGNINLFKHFILDR